MSVKKMSLKNFQMSEQYLGCLDKMSEENFSPAETLNDILNIDHFVSIHISYKND